MEKAKSSSWIKAETLKQVLRLVLQKTEWHLIEKHDLMEFKELEKQKKERILKKKHN